MGTVTKDVNVSGGTVIVTGKIGDDLRVMGGNVTLDGSVGGEIVGAGGNINLMAGVQIAKGVSLAGGQVGINGSIGGDLKLASDNIVFGEGTKVGGNFDYYAQKETDLSKVKVAGATSFHQQQTKKPAYGKKAPWLAFFTFWWVIGVAGAIVLAYLLFYLWPKDSKEMIDRAFVSPGREIVRGFVLLFIIPIAAIICLVSLIGFPLGVFVGFAYAALTMLAAAVSGLLAAAMLAKFVFRKKETELNWWLIALGLFILALIKLIPFVGWIFAFLVYLVALGVLGNLLYQKLAPEE
jgi:hypothetical protein